MRTCCQMPGLSVLEHGLQVETTFNRMLVSLHDLACGPGEDPLGSNQVAFKWPAALVENAQEFLARLLPAEDLALYQRYHDCGKPLVRVVDEEGRAHFPDHARASAAQWLACGGSPEIAGLIQADMFFHTCSAQECDEFAKDPRAASLWLTALAEIHANAEMFGGRESSSFKMKFKQLDRRGRALLKSWSSTL